MFQRRLAIIFAIGLGGCLIMVVQVIRLAVLDGSSNRAQAEARLETKQWIPTWRGTIFDRHGRPLARDVPGYEVAVAWEAITGTWATAQAVAAARSGVGGADWNTLAPERREELVAASRPQYEAVLDRLWSLVAQAGGQSASELERDLDAQRARIQHMAAVVWERQRQRYEARYGDDSNDSFRARPIAEQEGAHVLLPHITDAQILELAQFAESWPGLLDIRYARHREQPLLPIQVELDGSSMPRPLRSSNPVSRSRASIADGILGGIRYDVWAEDIARRPFRDASSGAVDRGGYRDRDRVGSRGIERGWEDHLRGSRGVVRTSRRTGETHREPPVPGEDVTMTIDARLQARVEAILDEDLGLTRVQPWHGSERLPEGTPLSAAAVVLEIETGEILAMASAPGEGLPRTAAEETARPSWLHRAVEAAYPPGSIIKPLVMAAAMAEGQVQPGETINCRGHHFADQPGIARCWIYRPRYGMATHGELAAREALARSCNCYFYELGDRLGLERMARWLAWFGMGQSLPVGLSGPTETTPSTVTGNLPDEADREALRDRGEARFESVMMAIGQGRLTWTPLHAANAYATLARGGQRLSPTLIRGYSPTTSPMAPEGPRPLAPEVIQAALDGMELAVRAPWGTGSRLRYDEGDYEPIFTHPEVRVMGKTGTAQAPPWPRDVNGDGEVSDGEQVDGLEHAWFVGLVGDATTGSPRYALAVLVEYGGSGGRVAGPIANQIIGALITEGYLDPDGRSISAGIKP